MFTNHKNTLEFSADVDSIHNYYEQLVLTKLLERHNDGAINADHIADITCVALNRLPPRYIRYNVDMSFYLSPKEYEEIENKVERAIDEAVEFVRLRGERY